jgi:hypothetical protein
MEAASDEKCHDDEINRRKGALRQRSSPPLQLLELALLLEELAQQDEAQQQLLVMQKPEQLEELHEGAH